MKRVVETRPIGNPIALVALHAGYSHTSLALQSIKSFAAHEPFASHIQLFESLVNSNPQQLLEQLVALAPSVIGFSTYLWNIHKSLHLAGLLEQLLSNPLIVLGGPEAGPRAEELLMAHPEIDFIIDGEGERSFRDLMRWHFSAEGELGLISGLVYRS